MQSTEQGLSLSDDGEERSFHPLMGSMLPVGDTVELHLEVSSEEPAVDSWPLGRSTELLPELSVVWEPGTSEESVFFTLRIVLDPSALAGGRVDG